MVRIRGRIGEWPVDLSIELDDHDWAQLATHMTPVAEAPPVSAIAGLQQNDALWQATLDLVRKAKQIEGPQLLAQLAALAGGEQAGKRLLVRLRHCAQVRMEAGADAPVYHWAG